MRHEHVLAQLLSNPPVAETVPTAAKSLAGSQATYVNELGSTMSLTFNADLTLTGTYTSNVSGGGGSVTGPIVGWYNGFVIAWSVLWPSNPPSMTSWVGAFVTGSQGYNIDTMWLLVSQAPQPGNPMDFWNEVNTGSDLFQPS